MKLAQNNSMPRLTIIGIVLAITLVPLVLSQVGMSFGSASRGWASIQLAGWTGLDGVLRFDIAALALVFLICALTYFHHKTAPSRFVTIMGTSLALAGLADAIQIIPAAANSGLGPSFSVLTVWSTTVSRAGAACVVAMGTLFLRQNRHLSVNLVLGQLLLPALFILGLAWYGMAHVGVADPGLVNSINLLTLAMYMAIFLFLRLESQARRQGFFGLGVQAWLIPLILGQLWLTLAVETIFNEGFQIAVLLKWFAWFLPATGLGVDLLNLYHNKGISAEKQLMRTVIDSIPHFIFVRDLNGRFILVNQAVADFYGRSVQSIEGSLLTDVYSDREQCQMWMEEDRQTILQDQEWNIPDLKIANDRGQEFWINSIKKPLKIGKGEAEQILGLSIDISHQKMAENALAQRRRFERASAAVLETFVHCTSRDLDANMKLILAYICDLTEANRSFLFRFNDDVSGAHRLFSWTMSSGVERPKPPDSIMARDLVGMRQCFEKNQVVTTADLAQESPGLERMASVLGQKEEFSFLAVPIFYHGELFGFLGADIDDDRLWGRQEIAFLRNVGDLFMTVWSKQEIERSLVQAMEAAQASSRAKSEFLANMSHEIRTPMNCVIGIADLLREMDPSPRQSQYLDMIHHSSEALLSILNDILDLSKIEAGLLELDMQDADLRRLVEDVVGLVAFKAQARGLEMVCRFAPGAPHNVTCDPSRLRQVLTNLLNNAAKFTKQGHIYLNVEPVGQENGQTQINFQVTDTGIGIPQHKLDKIFDKFTQADASTTRRFGGTGLGLSISRHLVGLMGGQISAVSTPGEGSTFSFTVPVTPLEKAEPRGHLTPEAIQNVLVVTRHVLSGEVMAEQVRHLGHECTIALGIEDALNLLSCPPGPGALPWSFILLDQSVMQGKAATMKLLRDRMEPDLDPTIILLNNISSMQREHELAGMGFSGALAKPVRPEYLGRVLAGDLEPFKLERDAKTHLEGNIMNIGRGLDEEDLHADWKPVSEIDSNGSRILLVEDNPFNQKVAVDLLRLLGCRVEVANNGREALAMIRQKTFDLIFMDCQMPEMDGYEATRQIRAIGGERSTVPIIAMTANALSGDRKACFASGMDDFLSKPITKAMLSQMLTKWELIPLPD